MGSGREQGRMHTASSRSRAEAGLFRGRRAAIAPAHVVVLCSSSDEDEEHLRKLLTHLGALEQAGVLRVWHPGKVLGGELRARRVRDEIARAAVVVLLVSPDFLVSEDFRSNEDLLADAASLGEAERSGRVVVPVVVRECLHETTALRDLQVLPRDGRPIAQADDPDLIWTDVAREIQQRLPDPEGRHAFEREPEEPRWRERVKRIRCMDPVVVKVIREPQVWGHDDRGEVDSAGEGVASERAIGGGVLCG